MTKHIVFRIVAGLVLLAAIAGIAFFAYNAGMANGATLNVQVPPAQAETQQLPFYGHMMPFTYMHTFPLFGFGCFGLLIPFFLVLLAFAAMRHLIWGPRWGWGRHMHGMHHGPWGEGVPPMFAEWHKRAHAEPPTDDATKQ